MLIRRSSSKPIHKIFSEGTPSRTRLLTAISNIVDLPHRLTPGTVIIFFRLMGSFTSRSITSNGISFCLMAISDLKMSFLIFFLYCMTKIWIISFFQGNFLVKISFLTGKTFYPLLVWLSIPILKTRQTTNVVSRQLGRSGIFRCIVVIVVKDAVQI